MTLQDCSQVIYTLLFVKKNNVINWKKKYRREKWYESILEL